MSDEVLEPHVLAGIVQCATCGVEYNADTIPDICPICADERQYLPRDGKQHWADPADVAGTMALTPIEDNLYGLDFDGKVGIHQRAKVLVTTHGSVMVDVPAGITAQAVRAVRELGPLLAIIPSHPHMYGLQTAWSRALDHAPVWISLADAGWLGKTPENVHEWDGAEEVAPGVTAAVLGGHFPGSAVVHSGAGAACSAADDAGGTGENGTGGVLLSGDTIGANRDGSASFMRSFPNYLPLSGAVVQRIAADAGQFAFDRLYDNFYNRIAPNARQVVLDSAARYAEWTSGVHDDLTGRGLNYTPSH